MLTWLLFFEDLIMDEDLENLIKQCNNAVLASDLATLRQQYQQWNSLYLDRRIDEITWNQGIKAISVAALLLNVGRLDFES